MSVPVIASEKEVLCRVADGDEGSFRLLFDAFRNRIFSFSMYLTKSQYMAEEITQEVFLRIWLNRRQLSGVQFFNAYLKTIAGNVASNYLKRLATERVVLHNIAMETDYVGDTTNNSVIYNEYQALLEKAIQRLPPQQKRVYLLSRHEGLKQDDIAKLMNLSPYTVKEYMKCALQSIRKSLGGSIDLAVVVALQIILKG